VDPAAFTELKERLPAPAFIECIVEHNSTIYSVGVDTLHNAWFSIRQGGYAAVLADGTELVHTFLENDARRNSGPWGDRGIVHKKLASYSYVGHVLSRPDLITNAEVIADRVIRLRFSPKERSDRCGWPGRTYTILIGEQARILSEQEDEQEPDVFAHIGEAAPGYPVMSSTGHGEWKLVASRVTPLRAGSASPVTKLFIEGAFEEYKVLEESALGPRRAPWMPRKVVGAPTRGHPTDASAAGPQPSIPANVDSPAISRWRWPLVSVGGVLILIGAFAWWRSRR
jgi:hypothetical protein